MTDIDRLPPHNIEAERAVLGALLIDPDAYHEIGDMLQAGDFYMVQHQNVYRAISGLIADGRDVDAITVGEVLSGREQGDVSTLLLFLQAAPTSLQIATHAAIVRATAQRRRLALAAGKIATLAYDEARAIDGVLGESEQALFDVTDTAVAADVVAASVVARDLLDHTERMSERGGQPVGLTTGLIDLDRQLEGLKGSELIILAARPGMGKTSLALGIALHVVAQGKGVGLFTMEMSRQQVMQRMVAMETGIDLQRIIRGGLQEREWPLFYESLGRISEAPMWIDDSETITPSALLAKCRRLDARYGLDLVVVDYLGLMTSNRQRDNQTQEIGDISRGLKGLSKRLNIPVLALAQLNRGVESRQDKRPQLADLRDSGNVEQDADVVMFIYRDEYYHPETTQRANVAELNVAKHRNGPTGKVDLFWDAKITKFKDLAYQEISLPTAGVYRSNGH